MLPALLQLVDKTPQWGLQHSECYTGFTVKLHLPYFLRLSLMACFVPTLLQSLHAAEIVLSSPTTWQEESASGYTGIEGDWYSGSAIEWSIHSGYYEATTSGTGFVTGISLSSSALTNNAELTSTALGTDHTSYGILIKSTTLTNLQSGILTAYGILTGTGYRAYGVAIRSDSLLNNSGKLAAVTQGAGRTYSISCDGGSTLNNESGGIIKVTTVATGTDTDFDYACGITINSSSLMNQGEISVRADGKHRSYGILAEGADSILSNAAGAVLSTSASTSEYVLEAYGTYLSAGSLSNSGKMISTAQAYYNGYGIYMTGGATLTNELGGVLEASASNGSRAYGIYSDASSSLTNKGEVSIVAQEAKYYNRAVYLTGESVLSNEKGGVLTVTAYDNDALGIALWDSSSLINNEEIAITANGKGQVIGIKASSSDVSNTAGAMLVANVYSGGKGSISDTSHDYAHTSGISLTESNLTNSGNLSAAAQGEVTSYGIRMESNSTITNETGGILQVSSEDYGISASASSVVNRGNLEATAQDTYGYGIQLKESSTLTNEAGASLTGSGYTGISLSSSSSLNNSGELVAKGTGYQGISVWGSSTLSNLAGGILEICGTNYGVEISGATLYNKGNITATTLGTNYGYGVRLEKTSTFTNDSGGVLVASGLTNGIYLSASILNNKSKALISASTSGGEAAGNVYLTDTSTFYNAGVLNADSVTIADSTSSLCLLNGATMGAYTQGAEMSIQGGSINLGGSVIGTTVYPTAWGSTVTTSSDVAISSGALNVVDNVTLRLGGDLTVANDVTTTWNDYSLTIDNGDSVHAVSWKDELQGSWDGAMILTHDGTNMTITQQDVGSKVSIQSGTVIIGGGSLGATERLEIGGGEAAVNLSSSESSLSLHGEKGGHITGAAITADNVQISAGAGSSIVVDSSALTLDSGTSTLRNAVLAGSSLIESLNNAMLSLDNVALEMNEAIVTKGETSTLSSGTTLQSEGYGITFTLEENADVLNLTCSALDFVTVEGSLTLDFSSYADVIEAEWLAITFGNSESSLAIFNLADFSANLLLNGVLYDAVYVNAADVADATTTTLYIRTASIPEPTTATLSLLALTALAARRRRR